MPLHSCSLAFLVQPREHYEISSTRKESKRVNGARYALLNRLAAHCSPPPDVPGPIAPGPRPHHHLQQLPGEDIAHALL
jgi:hypothetical protein